MSTSPKKTRIEEVETDADSELPDGWTAAPLLDLCDLLRGVSYEKGEASPTPADSRIALLRANNIDGNLKFSDLQYVPKQRVSPEQILQVGDVVLAMSSGSKAVVGKAASVDQPWSGTFGAFCGVLRPSTYLNRRYFALYFQTRRYRDFISEISAGVNINNLKREYFHEIQFPVAPTSEEQRIAKRVDELLRLVTSTRERFNKASLILKHFRQAVLAAACSGKLTEDWRKANPAVESATELVQRIRKSHELDGLGHGGKAADPTEDVHTLSVDAFPDSWMVEELKWLCQPGRSITYGILKPGPDQPGGVPYVRVADFPRGRLEVKGIKKTTRKIAEEYKRSALQRADVLLSIRGTAGRVCRVPAELDGGNITQDTARVSVHSEMSADYIETYLRSPSVQRRLEGAMKGVAVRGVNIGDVRVLQVAVPPLVEQSEIVRRVEALFKLADAIEKRVAAASLRAERLTQAVLAKAFRGELVPTEAELARREGREYEPASLLLERIKAERAKPRLEKSAKRRTHARGTS